jgi:hypothetical protein
MRYTSFAFAALMLFNAACSNEEGRSAFVSEAQAATPPAEKDYGWKTTPDFSKPQAEAREYE